MSKNAINVKGIHLSPDFQPNCLNPVTSPWSLAQWGIGIVNPLPIGTAYKQLLLVATNYFSKWEEVEAYASIKDKNVTKFVWKNIVCRFGIPHAIVIDKGPQFDSSVFQTFCSKLKIKNVYSMP